METFLLLWLIFSVVSSAGALVTLGVVLVRLPANHFATVPIRTPWLQNRPILRPAAVFLKNLLGVVLVALGLIMSVPGVPGPGILTVVVGLMLIDFAEKRRWTRWAISRPLVLRAANGLRAKYGRPPFTVPRRGRW